MLGRIRGDTAYMMPSTLPSSCKLGRFTFAGISGMMGAASLTGCVDGNPDHPKQDYAVAAQGVDLALQACITPLTADGHIDHEAVAAAGWTVKRRKINNYSNAEGPKDFPLTSIPELTANQYEATDWARNGGKDILWIIRDGGVSEPDRYDNCSVYLRTNASDGAARMLAKLTRRFGKPLRTGSGRVGGDGLSWQTRKADTMVYWQRPQHDIYLQSDDDGNDFAINITAIPDRSQMSKNQIPKTSYDHPNNIIVTEESGT